MSSSTSNLYTIKMSAGGKDFSQHLNGLMINVSKDKSIQIIKIEISLNREMYNKTLLPYKDNVKLEITSTKKMEGDNDPPEIDATFSYELTIMEDGSNEGSNTTGGNVSPMSKITLTCLPRKIFKAHQKIIKNKVFINKSRKQIIDEILEGSEHVIESDLYKEGEPIDQLFLPPLRQVAAIKHVDHYVNLFKAAKPTYINYSIDGKIHVGSCIKNNLKPLKIYYASDSDTLTESIKVSGKSSSRYDYVIRQAIQQSKNYNSVCTALGKKQSYNFCPMNKLYSRIKKNLNEFDDSLGLSNVFGDDPVVGQHVQKTNNKETWMKAHNGLPVVDSDEDNQIFADNHISDNMNGIISLIMKLDSPIKFKDFLYVGRLIKLTCDLNSIKYNGDYFLDAANLTFKSNGNFWTGNVTIKASGSIKLSNV